MRDFLQKLEAIEETTEPSKESSAAEESSATDETSPADESSAADETSAVEETSAADETLTDNTVKDETGAPSDGNASNDTKTPDASDDVNTSAPPISEEDGQLLEDDINGTIQLFGDLKGKAFNTVTIWDSANARAYRVALEDLKGAEEVEGTYHVDYSVDPVGSADIAGAYTVMEGEGLYFGVNPQVGYEIESVMANGMEVVQIDAADVASASNYAGSDHVYVVEEVDSDLEIVVVLEETDSHPEFNASYTASDGVKISLHAEEGILPEGTELQVIEIASDSLKEAFKEKVAENAIEDDGEKRVADVVLYDINLLLNGEKLDNSWSSNGYVDVTFSGSKISSMTQEADQVEIYAVDDSKVEKLTADNAAVAESETLELESVSSEDVTDTSVSSLSYQAEHFTIMGIATFANSNADVVVKAGETLSINGSDGTNHQWTSNNSKIATVSGNGSTAKVTGVSTGSVTIKHSYKSGGNKQDSYLVEVVKGQPSITLSPSEAKLTQINQTAKLTYTLKNMDQGSIVEWSSSDESVATVEGGVVTAVGEGTATIKATAFPEDDEFYGQTYSAQSKITVQFSKYKLYYYALVPGMSDTNTGPGQADKNWFGIGVTWIQGVPNPASLKRGIHSNLSYKVGDTVVELYPDITFGERTYKYAENGSENAYKEGYYTLNPYRLVVAGGANIGKNGHNKPAVNDNINTYHLDHVIILNEKSSRTVTFNVQYPGADEFASLTDYAQRVKDGTFERELTKPAEKDVPGTQNYNGVTYRFDGWYTDQNCTTKAQFNGTITGNKAYYAKYVPINQKYTVEYYYDNAIDSTMTETLGPVEIGSKVTSYPENGKEKNGYTFDYATVSTKNPLIIDADVSKNVIKVYYTKRNVRYSVNYYWNGTTEAVADSVAGSAKFGDEITGHLKTVPGYTAVDPDTTKKSIVLTDDQREINFYYYKNAEIKANGVKVPYNGTNQTVSGYTAVPSGVTFTGVSVSATGKNIGTYDAKFGKDIVGTVDTSKKYIITKVTDGRLVITPCEVKVQAIAASKMFGQDDPVFEADVEGLVNGESKDLIKYTVSRPGAGTDEGVGVYPGAIVAGGAENQGNYHVSYVAADFTIIAAAIEGNINLNPMDASKVYDGKSLKAAKATATDVNGGDVQIEYSLDGKSWTEDYASITATKVADSKIIQVRASGANYDGFVEKTQKLTIIPRPVNITGGGWLEAQPYTGSAYTKTEYVVEPYNGEKNRGLLIGHFVSRENFHYQISGTNVGEYEGEFFGDVKLLTSEGENVTSN